MSNDDLGGLPPLGNNPLDGDLFGDLPQPAASPLATEGALIDEAAPAAPTGPVAGDTPLPEPIPEEPEEPEERSPGFLSRLAQSSPYTVMLFASLVALLVGILCLLLEWHSYNFDTKAKEAHQSAQISSPLLPAAGVLTLPGRFTA